MLIVKKEVEFIAQLVLKREIGCVVDGYVTDYASGALDTCSGPVQQLGGLQNSK